MDGRRGLDRVTDSIDNLRTYLLVLVVQDQLAAVVWLAAVVAATRHHGTAAAHRPPEIRRTIRLSNCCFQGRGREPRQLLSGQEQGTKSKQRRV
jgi:hypothetical protein